MELIMNEILTLETLYFMNLYKKNNVKPYSFLVIDTILASDNLLRIAIGKAGGQFLRLKIRCRHTIREADSELEVEVKSDLDQVPAPVSDLLSEEDPTQAFSTITTLLSRGTSLGLILPEGTE